MSTSYSLQVASLRVCPNMTETDDLDIKHQTLIFKLVHKATLSKKESEVPSKTVMYLTVKIIHFWKWGFDWFIPCFKYCLCFITD